MTHSNNKTCSIINRASLLYEKKQIGKPYFVRKSDIRELGLNESDELIVSESCNKNPDSCGKFVKSNERCLAVGCKIICINKELLTKSSESKE